LPIGKAKRAHTEMPTDAGEDRIWVGELWPQPLVVVESCRPFPSQRSSWFFAHDAAVASTRRCLQL